MIPLFKYGIIENIHTVRRMRIGRFWGVTIWVTSLKWLGPIVFFSLHLLVNLFNMILTPGDRLYQSLLFAIAVELTTNIHAFGHILSGKMVSSAMDELLITTTRDVNLYRGDQSVIPGYIHLVRSLGGPLLNLIVSAILILISARVGQGFFFDLLKSLIGVNLFYGVGSFFPIPTVDGEVIWREVIRAWRSR
jgi:hypothetical protein